MMKMIPASRPLHGGSVPFLDDEEDAASSASEEERVPTNGACPPRPHAPQHAFTLAFTLSHPSSRPHPPSRNAASSASEEEGGRGGGGDRGGGAGEPSLRLVRKHESRMTWTLDTKSKPLWRLFSEQERQ